MRDPQSIHAQRRRTADSGLVDRCRRSGVSCWLSTISGWSCRKQQHHAPPLGLAHLLQPVLGRAGRALLPDGWLRQQGRAAARHELAILDADLLCDAGRHRRGALFPAAAAAGFALPACGTHVQSDFHFCPQCDYQLTASCGNCFRTVRATDQFCTRCGHELASDHMPARLRVMGE